MPLFSHENEPEPTSPDQVFTVNTIVDGVEMSFISTAHMLGYLFEMAKNKGSLEPAGINPDDEKNAD